MNNLISHVNFAKGFRGGERQTFLLINELSEKSYKQKLFVRKESELIEKCKNIKNLEIIEIAKPYILSISKLKDSSIIHAHETKGAQFAFFANIFFDIPYIITRRVDNKISNNLLNKKIYQNAKFSVSLSLAIKKGILEISENAKIEIIPSASSKLVINKIKSNEIKKRFKEVFLVGNIGELDNKHKGQFYLIEAAKKLQLSHPNIHIIFLGKGIDAENYKTQSKDLTNITFEGFVSNVGDYINAFDLFVFPSLHEGLGSILFDIMQANVPIIATNVGGIPDIVENNDTGILINAKSSNEIYDAILKLYNNKKLRNDLASNAHINANNYLPIVMAEKYIKLYEK